MPWALHNPLFEDEVIQTFGEGTAPSVTAEEVNDAEVETKKQEKEAKDEADKKEEKKEEKESEIKGESEEGSTDEDNEISPEDETPADQYSDDELEQMSLEQLRQVRFIPRFEYGTPAGPDNPGGYGSTSCPNCGNEDAGDIAIIDAEIAPGDTKEGEGDAGAPVGEPAPEPAAPEAGEEEGLGEEIQMYLALRNKPSMNYALGIPEMADWQSFKDSAVQGLRNALKFLIIKAAKYARKSYIFARNKITHSLMKLTTIHKLWARKLNKALPKISEERLSRFEIESFPYDTWIEAAKVSLEAYNVVESAERIVFDRATETNSPMVRSFSDRINHIGIHLSAGKRRINMDEFLDKRQFSSITGLGFTKSQIPNCIRYLGEMAKRISTGKNLLETNLTKCVEKSSAFASQVNDDVEKGAMDKHSDEYRDACDIVMRQTVRIDFMMVTMRMTYTLFDQLICDVEKVFSKYEDALAKAFLTD